MAPKINYAGLTEKEIQFCKFYEEHLTKVTATFDKIKAAADIIGLNVDTSCPSCSRNAWLNLSNYYNRWKDAYVKTKEPIYTKYEEEVIKEEEPVFENPIPNTPKNKTKRNATNS